MAGNGKSLAHRESVRYAAMNRGRFDGGDALANHNGFIRADEPRFQKLPDPSTQARYSDDQLYAFGPDGPLTKPFSGEEH